METLLEDKERGVNDTARAGANFYVCSCASRRQDVRLARECCVTDTLVLKAGAGVRARGVWVLTAAV